MATDTSNFNFQGIGIVSLVDGGSGGSGCMDQNANNYNPAATVDDDSCLYDDGGPGCTNPNALNYNPAATSDDGTCVYDPGGAGCTDPLAVNYNSTATFEDGTCVYVQIPGCMDPLASNYDPTANTDDGTCTYVIEILGCLEPTACNYDPLANVDDGTCILPDGCTNPLAVNYDPLATCDDGSCVLSGGELGCTDPTACNYSSSASEDDGTCDYSCFGCMDNGEKSLSHGDDFDSIYPGHTACNYDALATVNDGSCFWNICCSDCDKFVDCCGKKHHEYNVNCKDCCSWDNGLLIKDVCRIKKFPGCMDNGRIEDYICVMDPTATYSYELPNGTIINEDAKGIIGATGNMSAWPGAGFGDHPDFINQSNCHTTLYMNNDGGIGSVFPGVIAQNYNPFATFDDGSCKYKKPKPIKGCLDSNACNNDCAADPATGYPKPGPCTDGVTKHMGELCLYHTVCEDCDGSCDETCVWAIDDHGCKALLAWSGKGGYHSGSSGMTGRAIPDPPGCCLPKTEGCMDPNASNHNCPTGSTSTTPCGPHNYGGVLINVNVQDNPSSCVYNTVYGCTDPIAANYDKAATVDDGSCIYKISGCTEPLDTCNYDPLATIDDGSCCFYSSGLGRLAAVPTICGCTDPSALNYDASANCDDGSCKYVGLGCTDPNATNYDPSIPPNQDNGSCVFCGAVGGCTAKGITGWWELDGTWTSATNATPMSNTVDSGYVGYGWGTHDGNGPGTVPSTGPNIIAPAWDYLTSNGLVNDRIDRYYGTDYMPWTWQLTSDLCMSNPADFNGEKHVLEFTGNIAIYNHPSPWREKRINGTAGALAVLATEVVKFKHYESSILDVITWLKANVSHTFNVNMTYEEINQEYKAKNPQIQWDDSFSFGPGIDPTPVFPIIVGQGARECCYGCQDSTCIDPVTNQPIPNCIEGGENWI